VPAALLPAALLSADGVTAAASAFDAALLEAVGSVGLIAPVDSAGYSSDWRGLVHGRPRAVVRPASTDEVAAVIRACATHGVAIVPQGGHTSLVAGATPDATGSEIVLSLSRMARIRAVDPEDLTLVAEAGVPWAAAQQAAADAGCLLPLSISSEGSAQVGGVLSANAGGNTTIRYGNARDLVLGIEAVWPDGTIWHGLRSLRKDNTGYHLRGLLVGAEGTLGVITAAVLRLAPALRLQATALCALPSVEAVTALFHRVRATGGAALQAFEYISGTGMALVAAHISGMRVPFVAQHYALIDLGTPGDMPLRPMLEAVLAQAMEDGVVNDAVLADSDAHRQALWRLREEQAEAQRRDGASIKHDVSVAPARVPALIAGADAACAALMPGMRTAPFGHVGDGNVHYNVLPPPGMDGATFLAQSDAIGAAINAVVHQLDGSFSAEHGVGRIKRDLMPGWRGGSELSAMRRIKAALDPQGLMNPGKVLP